MERAVVATAGVITSITPFGLFLVLALVIPHPFPGVAEAADRILYSTLCVLVMVGSAVITWRNRETMGLARIIVRLTTGIFVLTVLTIAASFLFKLPGLITVAVLIAVLTLPVWVFAILNRVLISRGTSA